MQPRLGYIITDASGQLSTHTNCKPLSDHQMKLYDDAQKTIREVHNIIVLAQSLKINLENIDSIAEEYAKFSYKNPGDLVFKEANINEYQLKLNNSISNLLSSFRCFIDCANHSLSSSFGKRSKEFNEFLRAQNAHYDDGFTYGFFYKLRNYTQHCVLPTVNVQFLGIPINKKSTSIPVFKLLIDPQGLLDSSYEKWGKSVKSALQAKAAVGEKIDLAIELPKLSTCLSKLTQHALDKYRGRIRRAGRTIISAWFASGTPREAVAVHWDGRQVTGNNDPGGTIVPIERFKLCWERYGSNMPFDENT